MLISNVTMHDWVEFKRRYPLHVFNKTANEIEIQCIESCNPTSDREVIGIFNNGELVGMMAYAERHLTKKIIIKQKEGCEERELRKEKSENSIPIDYIYSMIVCPQFRRNGLSIQMMNYILSYTEANYLMLNPTTVECHELVSKLGFDFHSMVYFQEDDMVLPKTV